jgi:hypothetical protein
MDDKKPTSIPYRHKGHEAYQHNTAPRLEGIVKNIGTKPVRKPKHKAERVTAALPA